MKSKKNSINSSNKDFSKSIKRLMTYMKGDYLNIAIVFLFSILSTVFLIVGPRIMGQATTEIFNGLMRKISNPQEGIDFTKIFKIVVILGILYTISSVFSYLQSYIMSGVAQRISYNLRREISEKFNKLPISYYDNNSRGDIISRVTNDVDTLSQTLNQSLMQVVTSIITVVGVFIMMLSINIIMTIAALIILPITMFILMFIINAIRSIFR